MSIEIHLADITQLTVDAVVNAANPALLGDIGVEGTLHRSAGPGLAIEYRTLPELRPGVRCATGDVHVTSGHRLPARHVFHTVGPVWRDGNHDEPALLANCYWNCLQQAQRMGLESIAFPVISCGVEGFPLHLACQIAVTETLAWHRTHRHPLHILLVAANTATSRALHQALSAQGQPAGLVGHPPVQLHTPMPRPALAVDALQPSL